MLESLVIALAAVALAAVALVAVRTAGARTGPDRRPRYSTRQGLAERERAATAQAEVEEHDIDEMVEAIERLRRRAGERSIGDELADEVRRPPDQPK